MRRGQISPIRELTGMPAVDQTGVEHVGTHFHDLSFPEQFLVWAVRMWLRASCQSPKLFQMLGEAFQVLGLPEAGQALDKGMCILSAGTERDLIFFGPESECLSSDEYEFIRIISAYQAKDVQQAEAVLDTWLPLAGTRVAGAAYAEFASLMSMGGLSLIQAPSLENRNHPSAGDISPPATLLH